MVLGEKSRVFLVGLSAPMMLNNFPSAPSLRNSPGTVQTTQTQEILRGWITEPCALKIIPNFPSLKIVEVKTEGDGKGLQRFATVGGRVYPSSVNYRIHREEL